MSKKLEMLKAGVSIIVSLGVGAIVGNAVRATTPENIGKISKILIGAGSLALVGLTGDKVSNYVEERIDHTLGEPEKTEEKTGEEVVKGIIEEEA